MVSCSLRSDSFVRLCWMETYMSTSPLHYWINGHPWRSELFKICYHPLDHARTHHVLSIGRHSKSSEHLKDIERFRWGESSPLWDLNLAVPLSCYSIVNPISLDYNALKGIHTPLKSTRADRNIHPNAISLQAQHLILFASQPFYFVWKPLTSFSW